jgi:uncharacterized protein YecT (DUF1311 family)
MLPRLSATTPAHLTKGRVLGTGRTRLQVGCSCHKRNALHCLSRHGGHALMALALGDTAMGCVLQMCRQARARASGALLAWVGPVLVSLLPAALPAAPSFSPAATATCVQTAQARSASLSGHAVLDCVGRAAQACMREPGGDTTIGMIDCLGAENAYWDARLNAAYRARMAESRRADDETTRLGSSAASLADTLRAMQRAWIGYRDASCLHEQAQWQGGTGGGPATMACHMQETARQALKLEGWWRQ